jgi:hypothetical protein
VGCYRPADSAAQAAGSATRITVGVSQVFGFTPLGPVAWAIVAGSSLAGSAAAIVAPRLLPALDDRG